MAKILKKSLIFLPTGIPRSNLITQSNNRNQLHYRRWFFIFVKQGFFGIFIFLLVPLIFVIIHDSFSPFRHIDFNTFFTIFFILFPKILIFLQNNLFLFLRLFCGNHWTDVPTLPFFSQFHFHLIWISFHFLFFTINHI